MSSSNVAILDKSDFHPSPFRDPRDYSEALSNYALFQCNGVTLGYLLGPIVAALRSLKSEHWDVSGIVVEFKSQNDMFEKRLQLKKEMLTSGVRGIGLRFWTVSPPMKARG